MLKRRSFKMKGPTVNERHPTAANLAAWNVLIGQVEANMIALKQILVATSAFVEYHERDLRESWWFQRRFLSASAVGFASVGKGHMFRQVLPHATM